MATPLSGVFSSPSPRPSKAQGIAAALSGFGAGVQGRGPEYVMAMQEQQKALSDERQKAMVMDAATAYQLLKAGNYDDAISLMDDRVMNISKLGGDPSDTLEIRQLVTSGRVPEALAEIESFLSDPRAQAFMPEIPKPEIIPASSVIDGQVVTRSPTGQISSQQVAGFQPPAQKAEDSYRILTSREAGQMGLDPTKQYQINDKTGQVAALGGGGVSVSTTVAAPGSDKYIEERSKAQATSMGELEKSAESAYRANQALDRFVQASANGDAGAAQPFITGTKNLIASFGYDPAGLTDTVIMQQAVGDILGAKMAELGARGLTDKDMQILREALPRVETSHDARVAIADILKRANMNTLREYDAQVKFEEENYPQANFRRPSWLESVRPTLQSQSTINDPLGILQ